MFLVELWRKKYLQQSVASLQLTVVDGGTSREDVLDVDGSASSDGDVSRRDAEAETFGTWSTLNTHIVCIVIFFSLSLLFVCLFVCT